MIVPVAAIAGMILWTVLFCALAACILGLIGEDRLARWMGFDSDEWDD